MRTSIKKALATGALAGALALTAACASSTKTGQSPTTTPTTAPPPTTTPAPSTSLPTPMTMDVRVYFIHGDQIAVAHRTVTATQQTATAAMTELLAGPNATDSASGLATAIPAASRLLGINISGGLATVDLTGAFASGGGTASMTDRLAQVTFTLTQFATINGVVFHLDGKAVSVFSSEGIILDHPATRAGFESITPPILVEYPGKGWAVQSPMRVAGSANVFEAQFQAEIKDSTGHVIAAQSIHATSGTGTRGTFDTTIAFSATATGPATLTVFDISPRDGSRIDVVTVPLQLAGG
jgi:sporulation and spore germination protein/immunoglobulin-like protein involved in spore germination